MAPEARTVTESPNIGDDRRPDTQVVDERLAQAPLAELEGPVALRVVRTPLGQGEAADTAVLGAAVLVVEADPQAAIRGDRDVGIELQLVLALRPDDAVEHVAGRRDGA